MSTHKERVEIVALYAEVVAAIGVIVSVIYLAVQIGGNTAALKTQAHHNLLTQANQPLLIELDDQELGEIIAHGLASPEELSEGEWRRFFLYQLMSVNSWEYGYYLNKDKSTPPELWEGLNAYYVSQASSYPGMKKFWQEFAFVYAEPFRSYADQHFQSSLHNDSE